MSARRRPSRRVRWTLLVLLWIWAACVFTVLDLFKNVEEFDRIRPDSRIYEGMRVAAHRMIGEPIQVAVPAPPAVGIPLARDLERARATDDPGVLALLASDGDPRVRLAALEKLGDREELLRIVRDETETPKMRRTAARLLGCFGTQADMEQLLADRLPAVVRSGAILGLGEMGTIWAAETLLALEDGSAIAAIERLSTSDAGVILRPALLDGGLEPETRLAICRALARIPGDETGRALADVLADTANPPAVRATAANSLGRLQYDGAAVVLATAIGDSEPDVARQAHLAETRLR